MPRATVSLEPKTYALKTCPDGHVKLRRMSYGELMASQDMMYQIQMKASESDPDNPEMGVDISRAAIAEYQFKVCIVDHDLEDETGRKLDFKLPKDVHLLDSNIGQEIYNLIDEMHNYKKQFPNSEQPSGNGLSMNGQSEMAKTSDVTETSLATS